MLDPFELSNLARVAYNKTADKYHECFKDEMQQKEYDRFILDRISNLTGQNSLICDAGCGPSGHIGKYLSDKGHKVIGIDISERCIEIARNYNPSMQFEQMDLFKLKFEPNSFDAIISFYSILYSSKNLLNRIFENFNKILKPGGKLLVVIKKGVKEGFLENDEWYKTKVYFSLFVENEIVKYFQDAGFSIDFLETRKPYDFEMKVERIYAIGTKIF